ncbi:MAG: OmpA family protein [Dysgonamonadaceae bacterium]|jgi:outer membrane protein OmpA-like peptidoglycan-associated protein|nr:OmpA family protein [Dysgonamonadaceae bacterium]
MRTKIFLFSVLVSLCGFSTFAQESHPYTSTQPGYLTAYKHSGAGENWFIHVGAGGQVMQGDFDEMQGNFLSRITLMPTVSVGKLFNPYWGLRLKAQGGSLHGFENAGDIMQHFKYYNVHLDAMWNWMNYWGVPEKKFNFGPYIGLGFTRRLQGDQTVPVTNYDNGISNYNRYSDALSVNSGFNFGYAFSKRVSLDFDLGVQLVPDYFDRAVQKASNEAVFALEGGLTFKLGKVGFDAVEPMDYGLIDDLNNKLNSLRAENANLSKRPVSCPECPKVAPVVPVNEINYVPNVVFFRLDSDKIDANQQISVYNTAEFVKNTGENIKVIGYADVKTGNPKYNLDISKRRAQAVAKELMTKYNIPSEKISVEWHGDTVQPYAQNNWNRVVIMTNK